MPKATCSIPECDRPAKARGWCRSHYMRWFETGDVRSGPIRAKNPGRGCGVEGCDLPYSCGGYCAPHYKRAKRYGDPGPVDIPPRRVADDKADYRLIHSRLRALRGRARDHRCVQCLARAAHWAYDHSDPAEKVDVVLGAPYSLDVSRYMPMCARCHKRFDKDLINRERKVLSLANVMPLFLAPQVLSDN